MKDRLYVSRNNKKKKKKKKKERKEKEDLQALKIEYMYQYEDSRITLKNIKKDLLQ